MNSVAWAAVFFFWEEMAVSCWPQLGLAAGCSWLEGERCNIGLKIAGK